MLKVKTEIHLHIDHSSVDYRPVSLGISSFLKVEHPSVCCNIVAECTVSKIELKLEEAGVYQSNRPDIQSVNLARDFV